MIDRGARFGESTANNAPFRFGENTANLEFEFGENTANSGIED